MKTATVNYVNMGLMVISLIAAFLLPFEVFLFSYAILGPLHYLTEISWLHDRNYFSEKKYDYILLVILSVLIMFGSNVFEQIHIRAISGWTNEIAFGAFGAAFIFVLVKDTWKRVFACVVLLAAVLFFHSFNQDVVMETGRRSWHYLIFTIYLPTLIHVYIFTGAFILFGALKRNSTTGYISMIVFILCPILCFVVPFTGGYEASSYAVESYGNFRGLNQFVIANFYEEYVPIENVFSNPISIVITRFIAFAYTYHYLNWFSKTSVIQWHKVPKLRFALVLLIWVASIVLYVIDYALGFQWLFLLSFMHVYLEFPLNHRSFIGIGQELGKKFGKGQTAT